MSSNDKLADGRNPLRAYADSYRQMAEMGDGKVHCLSVAADIENNMIKHAAPAPVVGGEEVSPEFTDTARAAIAWVLWHHQGGSSPVGQPLRFALGMSAPAEAVGELTVRRYRGSDAMVNYDFDLYATLPDGSYELCLRQTEPDHIPGVGEMVEPALVRYCHSCGKRVKLVVCDERG